MKASYDFNKTVEILGIERRTLYYWLEKGYAPKHERLHGRYIFDKKSVDALNDLRKQCKKLRSKPHVATSKRS